jgi:GT2 family glycosyltransferase
LGSEEGMTYEMKCGVLVMYNTLELLQQNFGNIYQNVSDEEDPEFIIVDNGSTDTSVAYLNQHFPGVTVIQQGKNVFFPPSANRGIQEAKNELILLLNPDVKIGHLNLHKVKELFQRDVSIFSVSPKVIDPRDDTQEHLFCFTIRKGMIDLTQPTNFNPEKIVETSCVTFNRGQVPPIELEEVHI